MAKKINSDKSHIKIVPLSQAKFEEAVNLVLKAGLDSREEIEHHLKHLESHFLSLDRQKIVGIIGWYRDNVYYASTAMGDKFPGVDAYWVGFFAVDQKKRGLGIGFSLLKKLEETVKAMGADKLYVSSIPQTRFYYQRQGFKLLMTGKISGNLKFFMVKDLK